MGQDKGLVLLNNTPLIEHVLTRLSGLADETLITTNHSEKYEYLNIPLAADKNPGAGALTGLQTALESARGEYVFVIACDMPFVSRDLAINIISLGPKADAIIPYLEDRYQPLHALYHRDNCLPAIKQVLSENQKRVITFHPLISVHAVTSQQIAQIDPDGRSFININTPEELAQAEQTFTQTENSALHTTQSWNPRT